MGTAPYNEFCLLCPADQDKKPDLLEVEKTARTEREVDRPQAPRHDAALPEQDAG